MSKKQENRPPAERKIDVRNVFMDKKMRDRVAQYILNQSQCNRNLTVGEAVVELTAKGLSTEGI